MVALSSSGMLSPDQRSSLRSQMSRIYPKYFVDDQMRWESSDPALQPNQTKPAALNLPIRSKTVFLNSTISLMTGTTRVPVTQIPKPRMRHKKWKWQHKRALGWRQQPIRICNLWNNRFTSSRLCVLDSEVGVSTATGSESTLC